MRIYQPIGEEGSELAHPDHSQDFETINLLINGEVRRRSWRSIPFHVIAEDEGKPLRSVDMPWLGSHALLLTIRALEALAPMLGNDGEFLELRCEPPLWVFNATRIVDALDEESSVIERFSSGQIMLIREHVFRPEAIGGLMAFKLPNLRVSPTYVTEAFVNAYMSAKLSGLEFHAVWETPCTH